MGHEFSINQRHQDILHTMYKTRTMNNDKTTDIKKSNSNLSKITTATNSGNSSSDLNNYDSNNSNTIISEDNSLTNEDSNDPWGFFEDIEPESDVTYFSDEELYCERKIQRAQSLPPPMTEPPMYILESNIRTQKLWYLTAGRRPQQPEYERRQIEKIWTENFKSSNVVYEKIKEKPLILKSFSGSDTKFGKVNKDPIPKSGNYIDPLNECPEESDEVIARTEFDVDIIMRGYQPHSNSVSKSFDVNVGPANDSILCITLQIPRFRVIKNKNDHIYAEFLVVITLGGYNKVKFGIWKRFKDFNNLALKVEEDHHNNTCNYSNSLLSWKCLIQRKRWFRCLEQDYLGFKCFLLERFLHDILFESSASNIISEFLNIE